MELEVYKKSDFYEDYIDSQKEYYERSNADAYFAELLAKKDKVIADKDAEIAQLQAMLEERNKQVGELKKACNDKDDWCLHTLKENRHQKFKRCLAMENWCMTEYLHSKCLDFTNTEQWYWRRWYIRWRNIAEKFKEAK